MVLQNFYTREQLIAKLIIEFGMMEFMKIFVIINMNEDIRYHCNRSIYMRIHDEWDTKIAKQTLH